MKRMKLMKKKTKAFMFFMVKNSLLALFRALRLKLIAKTLRICSNIILVGKKDRSTDILQGIMD